MTSQDTARRIEAIRNQLDAQEKPRLYHYVRHHVNCSASDGSNYPVEWREQDRPRCSCGLAEALAADVGRSLAPAPQPEKDNIFWPPKDAVEEHLYEIRNGTTEEYVRDHVACLRAEWRAAAVPSSQPEKK